MKDIKINDAAYFPRPQAIYKALPIARTMGEAAAEYMAGWLFYLNIPVAVFQISS